MFSILVLILLATCGNGLMKSMTHPDGSLDVPSLLSHITQLEQTMESKTAELETQFNLALSNLDTAQAELTTTREELSGVQSELKSTQTELSAVQSQLKSSNISSGGATFTRWGRTTCPSGNKMMYKGYTAGTFWSDKAASATILCLPEQPIFANHTSTFHGSYIYGTEYQTSRSDNLFHNLHDEDVPCVVCESVARRSTIMVPARNQCYSGWTLEYWGYLMGPADDHASGEFICVDQQPESIPGGGADKDGQLLHTVESYCGSLQCPPYEQYWELTCSVCTQ